MVNYHNPAVIEGDYLVLTKLWHATAGLYFWEFASTLDYEWSVFRGHRTFRWTIWIYFFTRIATLVAVVLYLVDIDVTGRYNCQVETIFVMAFGFLATAAASFLIVLRILAIWNMNKIVIAIATSAWGASIIFQIQTIVRIRVASIPGEATCVVANPHIANLNALVGFTTDIILLLIMFSGLFRLRFYSSTAFGMGRLLWRQGLIWLLVAFVADIVPMVVIYLNLNDPLDDICLAPWLVAYSIAATRIHRSLVDYASAGSTEQMFDPSHSKTNGHQEWKANGVLITHTQVSRMEAAVPERDETLQMIQHGSASSFTDVEGQYDRPAGLPRPQESVGNGVGAASATESSMT